MSLLAVYGDRPLLIESGAGCSVVDQNGRRYLDCVTGIGVNALGYGHPAVTGPLLEQASTGVLHTSNLHRHQYQEELASMLARWTGLEWVFFSNSGTEAMEAALKAARALANRRGRKRHRIVAIDNGFHGRTAGALAITGREKYRRPFEPLPEVAVFVAANDTTGLEAAVNEDTIAIVAETVQGEGGIHLLSEEFLTAIRRLATASDAVWIADEVQCGLGRTGKRFAYEHYPAAGMPDIVVTAKPLAGGLPLGATIFSEAAASAFGPGTHGTTFGGGPLACRVALSVLREIDRLMPEIEANGAYFLERLRAIRSPLVKEVRGIGLMAGIELDRPGDEFVRRALAEGMVINCTHETVLRLLPPYVISRAEIDFACDTVERILDAQYDELNTVPECTSPLRASAPALP